MRALHLPIAFVLLSASALFLSSCALLINGARQDVIITSNPPGAAIVIDGHQQGITPASLKLKRGKTHIIEISIDGYQKATVITSRGLTGWFWANILAGGLLGFIVDVASGTAYDIEPESVTVQLSKEKTGLFLIPDREFTGMRVCDGDGSETAYYPVSWH